MSYRKIYFIFLLAVFFALQGNQEIQFDSTVYPYQGPEGSKVFSGSYFPNKTINYIDLQSLEPVPRKGEEKTHPFLTREILDAILNWRSDLQSPWSTWVYEKNSSIISKYEHSLRGNLGINLMIDKDLVKYTIALNNEVVSEPKFIFNDEDYEKTDWEYTKWLINKSSEEQDKIFDDACSWGKQNVSYLSCDIAYLIIETFAWYTSPGYIKGSLPASFEEIVEDVLNRTLEDYIKDSSSELNKEYYAHWFELLENVKNKEPLIAATRENYLAPADVLDFIGMTPVFGGDTENVISDERNLVLIVGKPNSVNWVEDTYSKDNKLEWSRYEVLFESIFVFFGEVEVQELTVILDANYPEQITDRDNIFVLLDITEKENPEVLHWDPIGFTLCIGDEIVEELELEPWLHQFHHVSRMKCAINMGAYMGKNY